MKRTTEKKYCIIGRYGTGNRHTMYVEVFQGRMFLSRKLADARGWKKKSDPIKLLPILQKNWPDTHFKIETC